MSEEKLCEPCQMLLSRGRKDSPSSGLPADWIPFIEHHHDSASFERALQLPCSLCTLAWTSLKTTLPLLSGGTEYQIIPVHRAGGVTIAPDVRFISFRHSSGMKYGTVAFVPWQDMVTCPYPGLLPESTGASSAIGFFLQKYKECCKKHPQCRLQQSVTQFYPTRLVEVGELGDAYIRLRELRTYSAEGPYFCLSHCWGEKQPFKLTKETYSILQEGISLESLPKTFRDAILVTRNFQVRYLWIDSLCILQDDINDWSTEAKQMRKVYSHASCTIAATAARDGDAGLFFNRNPGHLRPVRLKATWGSQEPIAPDQNPPAGLYYCDHYDPWTNWVENAPLNRRAWVAQERYLSRRIMHFTATQLFWECHENRACEKYPSQLPGWAEPYPLADPVGLRRELHCFQHQSSTPPRGPQELALVSAAQIYYAWSTFLSCYSTYAMTKEEDKLVALLGVADEFGQALGDQLVAGLWKNRLLEELCWRRTDTHPYLRSPKPSKWRAPTWSWACHNSQISPAWTTTLHRDCSQKETWAELDHLDVDTKPSGELLRASIRVKCKLLRAVIDCPPELYVEPTKTFNGTINFDGSKVVLPCHTWSYLRAGITLALDMEDNNRTELEKIKLGFCHRVSMFIFQRCKHDESDEPDKRRVSFAEGLVLREKSETSNVFERMGTFIARGGEDLATLLREHERAETRVVTLV